MDCRGKYMKSCRGIPKSLLVLAMGFQAMTIHDTNAAGENGHGTHNECENTFTHLSIDPDAIESQIDQLPPVQLDYPSIGKAFQNMMQGLGELKPDFDQLKDLLNNIRQHPERGKELNRQAGERMQHYALEAKNLMEQGAVTGRNRHMLECLRHLMHANQGLSKEALRAYQEQKITKETQEQSSSSLEQQSSSNQKQQNSSDQQQQNSSDQQQQSPSNSKQQSSSNQQLSPQQQTSSNQKQQSSPDQQQQNSSDQQQQSPSNSKQQSSSNQQLSPQQQTSSNQKQQTSPDQQQQSSSDQQQQNPSNSKQQSSSNQQQSPPNQKLSSSNRQKPPSPGISDKIKNDLKQTPDKPLSKAKHKQESGKNQTPAKNNSDPDQQSESNNSPQPQPDPQTNQEQSNKQNSQNSSQSSSNSQDRNSQALQKLLNELWISILRDYESAEKFLNGLLAFRDLCNELGSSYSHPFLAQYSARAQKLHDELEFLQVSYKNLEDLGVTLAGGDPSVDSAKVRRLRYLNQVFQSLKEATSLDGDESETHDRVKHLLSIVESSKPTASDLELGMSFLSQCLGPLSRKSIRDRFPPGHSSDLNWPAMAQEIRSGQLNDLLIISGLKKYLSLIFRHQMKPRTQIVHQGPRAVISEASPELNQAEEIDQIQHFYRGGGAPLSLDFMRVLSGDMLMSTYRDPKKVKNPFRPKKKEVTILLYDSSGSMLSQQKFILRNYIMAAYADRSQVEVLQGKAEHVIYSFQFATTPAPPERVAGLKDAYSYFERTRHQPLGSGGENDFAAALVEAYETIAAHEKNGGEVQRANILMITDGEEDSFNEAAVHAARSKVSRGADIAFNVIALGEGNHQLQRMAEKSVEGLARSDSEKKAYHYIDYSTIQDLLNPRLRLDQLFRSARDYSAEGEKSLFSAKQEFQQLKERLVRLQSSNYGKKLTSMRAVDIVERWFREAEQGGIPVSKELKPFLNSNVRTFLFVANHRAFLSRSKSERLEFFSHYLEYLGKVSGQLSETAVLSQLDRSLITRLKRWLNLKNGTR